MNTRSTNWDATLLASRYDYSWLSHAPIEAALDIPITQLLQFRRIRSKLSLLSERGHDIECMTSEQLYGAALVAPQKATLIWSRCEFDLEVTDTLFQQISRNLPRLKAWFTTNLTASDPRLVSVPLGLNDFCGYSGFHSIAGDTDHFANRSRSHRTQAVLCCLNPNTRLQARLPVIDVAKKLDSVLLIEPDTTIPGFRTYLNHLKTSDFVLCPRGNGIDTHRFWEAIYMGCIPICLESEMLPCQRKLPHLALSSWSELETANLTVIAAQLRCQRFDLRSMCIDYWVDRVLTVAS